jgi:hypothetical protein
MNEEDLFTVVVETGIEVLAENGVVDDDAENCGEVTTKIFLNTFV